MSGYGNDKELQGDRGGGGRRAFGGDVDVSSRRRRSRHVVGDGSARVHSLQMVLMVLIPVLFHLQKLEILGGCGLVPGAATQNVREQST